MTFVQISAQQGPKKAPTRSENGPKVIIKKQPQTASFQSTSDERQGYVFHLLQACVSCAHIFQHGSWFPEFLQVLQTKFHTSISATINERGCHLCEGGTDHNGSYEKLWVKISTCILLSTVLLAVHGYNGYHDAWLQWLPWKYYESSSISFRLAFNICTWAALYITLSVCRLIDRLIDLFVGQSVGRWLHTNGLIGVMWPRKKS